MYPAQRAGHPSGYRDLEWLAVNEISYLCNGTYMYLDKVISDQLFDVSTVTVFILILYTAINNMFPKL
jgi:hypothetical protein